MDAIELLRTDHRDIEVLFERYARTDDQETRHELVDQLITALSVHAWLEEEFVYRAAVERGEVMTRVVIDSFEDHHSIRTMLVDLEVVLHSPLELREQHMDAIVRVLGRSFRHHVAHEEECFFPALSGVMGSDELWTLGERLVEEKESAPTRPGNPITRTLNLVRDFGRGLFSSATQLVRAL